MRIFFQILAILIKHDFISWDFIALLCWGRCLKYVFWKPASCCCMKNFVIYLPKSSLIQGSAKMEQATGCPEEITITEKSSKSVTSNGIVQIGNGESTVEPSSPEQKPEPSYHGDQSERGTAPNRVVSGN